MATFQFDSRGLPARLSTPAAQAAYITRTKDLLDSALGLDAKAPTSRLTQEYIVGKLLSMEVFDETATSFLDDLRRAWLAAQAPVATFGSTSPTPLRKTLDDIEKELDPSSGTVAASAAAVAVPAVTVFHQAFAFIADYVAANDASVPFRHPNFKRQVQIAHDRYISGPPAGDSLQIPALADSASAAGAEPANVQAVGLVYLGLQMDRMRLFQVVDRITHHYNQGLIALPFDAASRALDEYFWSSEDRLNEAARGMVYGRVLGTPGTEVSKDVQPNRDWDSILGRFIASVGEFDRERRISTLFGASGSATPTASSQEQIRKAGRDLLFNASLYGWGGTHPAARRISQHVQLCFSILSLPQLQRLYGVSSPYQVIERVMMNETGQSPNIVKFRTLAESGAAILNLVARYANAFASTDGRPLLTVSSAPPSAVLPPAIPFDDTERLINAANGWLAVNAIPAADTLKMSQPVDTRYAPSVPGSAGSPDLAGKLQQMIQSGTAPSLDQLQQLMPSFK